MTQTLKLELPHQSGEEVLKLQMRLGLRGITVAADGILGHSTDRAIRDFQHKSGLKVDGVVGPKTREALNLNA